MASKTPEGQAVSEMSQAEGGPTKGSTTAQMQSEITKQKNAEQAAAQGTQTGSMSSQAQSAAQKENNFEEAAQKIGLKMQQHPEQITKEDASLLESREHKAMGIRPPSDTIAADAQRLAAANEKAQANGTATGGSASMTREQQSQATREGNFQEAVDQVGAKMANDPSSVSKEDGDLLHSREQRARGTTEKGGIASEAQKLAAENEK